MRKALLVTLGHNASAMLVINQTGIIGYEQERIDGIKSSSHFPSGSILKIIENVGLHSIKGCDVFISHWFDEFDIRNNPNKYITASDYELLESISSNIYVLHRDFTHHDAHAVSAYEFFKFHAERYRPIDRKMHILVCDGFGNQQEVFSIYEVEKGNRKLVKRMFGYENSLGLMYQYATSFCGMKENQDEYKFLGYEPLIDELLNEDQISILDSLVQKMAGMLFSKLNECNEPQTSKDKTELIDFSRLAETKSFWHLNFRNVCDQLYAVCSDTNVLLAYESKRIIIARYIQSVLETFFSKVISAYNIEDCCVAGGVFYNVKLNNHILKSIPGLFSVMPLAGDQGAAIGLYLHNRQLSIYDRYFNFSNLCIGVREMHGIEKFVDNKNSFYVTEVNSYRNDVVNAIAECIANENVVNVVKGNMEFGPRALCNTSTLMLPTADLVAHNNHMNMRNEVMPCAPVMKKENAHLFFNEMDVQRVIGSNQFMICTLDYKKEVEHMKYSGVMHKKPLENAYTGRPQFVSKGSMMWEILDVVEAITGYRCLVNTSFNVHGRPIAFETMDIVHNFQFQFEHARFDKKPYLFIINNTI